MIEHRGVELSEGNQRVWLCMYTNVGLLQASSSYEVYLTDADTVKITLEPAVYSNTQSALSKNKGRRVYVHEGYPSANTFAMVYIPS